MSSRALERVHALGSGVPVLPAGAGNEASETGVVVGGIDYCAVTLLCGGRRVDVNLPSSLPWADLQANIVRLLIPAAPDATGPWELVPVGRPALNASESLHSAGVLGGDVLCLRPAADDLDSGHPIVMSVRDGVEDAVEARDEIWTPRTSLQFVLWCATVVGGLSIVFTATMMVDFRTVGLTFSVAIIVLMIAVFGSRRGETLCAALGVLVSCGWAAAGGCAIVGALTTPDPVNSAAVGPAPVVVGSVMSSDPAQFAVLAAAAGSALLIAICATAFTPFALVNATAFGVIAAAFGGLALANSAVGSTAQTGSCAAILALLAIGITPRAALAMSGLSALAADDDVRRPPAQGLAHVGASPGSAGAVRHLDRRVVRAQQLLTGMLIGLSAVAVIAAIPVLLSAQWWQRALAAGIGVSLLLRSRTFSQIPHLIAPRVGALIIFAGLAVGVHGADPAEDSWLLLGSMLLAGTLVFVTGWLVPSISPVGRARFSRILDLLDGAVVIGLLVSLCGLFGLFTWMAALIG